MHTDGRRRSTERKPRCAGDSGISSPVSHGEEEARLVWGGHITDGRVAASATGNHGSLQKRSKVKIGKTIRGPHLAFWKPSESCWGGRRLDYQEGGESER